MPKRISYNSPVVLTFSLISLVVLALDKLTSGFVTQNFFMLTLTSATDPLQYIRLFTHVLGHADWTHYSGNMMLLLLIGPMLEEKYGSRRLLVVVIVTALVTAFVNLLLFPELSVLGASGVVFAFILLASITDIHKGEIPLTLIIVGAIYIGGELLDAVFSYDTVSQISHIIGGAVGCLFGYIFMPRKQR